MKSLLNDPLRANPFSDPHRLDVHFAFRIDHRHLKAALQLRHSFLRDEQRSIRQIELHPDTAKLARAQGIVEYPLNKIVL